MGEILNNWRERERERIKSIDIFVLFSSLKGLKAFLCFILFKGGIVR